MKILKYNQDGTVLAEMSVSEANLIQKAVTAPIKRKVHEVSRVLEVLAKQIMDVKEFNDAFINTVYNKNRKKKTLKAVVPTKRGKK